MCDMCKLECLSLQCKIMIQTCISQEGTFIKIIHVFLFSIQFGIPWTAISLKVPDYRKPELSAHIPIKSHHFSDSIGRWRMIEGAVLILLPVPWQMSFYSEMVNPRLLNTVMKSAKAIQIPIAGYLSSTFPSRAAYCYNSYPNRYGDLFLVHFTIITTLSEENQIQMPSIYPHSRWWIA